MSELKRVEFACAVGDADADAIEVEVEKGRWLQIQTIFAGREMHRLYWRPRGTEEE